MISADQAARRVPYLATAATGVAGTAAWGMVEAAAAVGQPAVAGAVILGTWVATGAGLPVLRIRLRDRTGPDGCTVRRIPRAHRRRWWAAGGLAALWIDAMAAGAVDVVGPSGMAAVLLGGALALSARWMRDHDIELPTDTPQLSLPPVEPTLAIKPPPPPQKFPTPPPPDEGDLIAELWATRVASGPNPIAPGSELGDDRVDLPYGYQWVVQLDPVGGNISCTRLRGLIEDIALKLETKTTHIEIDHLDGDDAREDRALLTVITKDVLKEGIPYLGPEYHDGRIPLGKYADGSARRPYWVARNDTGPLSGMVTGGTGSGKSELLTRLGMALRASREFLVVFGDGDERGRSAPLLKRIAYDFAAGATDLLEQLAAVEAWFHARNELMGELTEDADGTPVLMTDPSRQEPARKLMPCRAFPGLVWILDEFHRMVTDPLLKAAGFLGRVAKLRRIGRKAGLGIYVGTQSAMMEDFGGDDTFRGQLAQDNCVIMRTKNRTDASVVADFGVDPGTLPKGGGYGVVDDDDDDGRKVMFRGEYSRDMHRWVRALAPYEPDELPALVYATKRPPKPADPVADYEETQKRKAAMLDAIESGEPLPWEPRPEQPGTQPVAPIGGDGAAAPGPAPMPSGDDASRWTIGGVGVPESTVGAQLLHMQAHRAGLAATATAAPVDQSPLRGKAQQVLVALASDLERVWTSAELVEATSLSPSDVSTYGGELIRRGLAHRPTGKQGRWKSGPTPAEGKGQPA